METQRAIPCRGVTEYAAVRGSLCFQETPGHEDRIRWHAERVAREEPPEGCHGPAQPARKVFVPKHGTCISCARSLRGSKSTRWCRRCWQVIIARKRERSTA